MSTLLPHGLNSTIKAVLRVTAAAWSVQAVVQTAFPATSAGHALQTP